MIGDDLIGPILANTVRVSVSYGAWLHVCDFDTDCLMDAVADFESYADETIRLGQARGTWKGVKGASSIANHAVRNQQGYLLAAAATWMFLNRPDDEYAFRLNALIMVG